MPAGGDLAVRTRRVNGGVRIEVSDTGEGLTEEERQRLFTPYYTTKQHGTGLGLAIVQSVVADHSGKVWVVSERGRGATFHIEIPAPAATLPTPARERAAWEASASGGGAPRETNKR
jgi:signal transduction histidine kinase